MSVGAPQQILSGKYRLERELGRGGMGAVWRAEHMTLRSPVAIKLIDPGIAENPEALSRFLREAQAAAALRSPHVVQILDHGVDDGTPFIVMELLEGESLAARLERLHRLEPGETARIITQVARAITRAHEAGIIHRDLKPDNIFLVHNDEEEVAKVLDFGVAKASSHGLGAVSANTRTGSVLGTPYYMSPEQAEGSKHVDGRSDVWSLGVIAWECLLGSRPFEAETLGGLLLAICARDLPVPSRVGPVPPGFDAWFARACSRSVAHRFGSAKELAAELRQVCAGDGGRATGVPSSAQPGTPVPAASFASTTGQLGVSSQREPLKKRSAWPAVLALGVTLLGAGAAAVWLRPPAAEPAGETASSAKAAPSLSLLTPTAPVPAASPAPPSSVAAPTASASATSAPDKVSAVPVVRPRPPAAAGKPPRPATATSASPAPAATPPPQPRPRVNLGI